MLRGAVGYSENVTDMAAKKRYGTEDAARLLRQVMSLEKASIQRVRRTFEQLIDAKLTDVEVEVGAIDVVVTDAQIANLQKGVSTILGYHFDMVAKGKKFTWTHSPLTVHKVDVTVSGASYRITGDVGALLSLQLYALLGVAGDRVRWCECGRRFVRIRRGEYCSPRCQKRVYMRGYRD
jgi:hypothetical protein